MSYLLSAWRSAISGHWPSQFISTLFRDIDYSPSATSFEGLACCCLLPRFGFFVFYLGDSKPLSSISAKVRLPSFVVSRLFVKIPFTLTWSWPGLSCSCLLPSASWESFVLGRKSRLASSLLGILVVAKKNWSSFFASARLASWDTFGTG